MKCEICNKADARRAIERELDDGSSQELYVCEKCAALEEAAAQKKRSSRTWKSQRGILTISGDMENPPPFIGALIDAVTGMVGEIHKMESHLPDKPQPKQQMKELSTKGVNSKLLAGDALHLEGLFLIGELDASLRALHALEMDAVSPDALVIKNPGHVYKILYPSTMTQVKARSIMRALLKQELNARSRLTTDMALVFDDSVSRALAILKNCRLLAAVEFYDMLSTLRLAAVNDMLEGIKLEFIDEIMSSLEFERPGDDDDVVLRDEIDAKRADVARQTFSNVYFKVEGDC